MSYFAENRIISRPPVRPTPIAPQPYPVTSESPGRSRAPEVRLDDLVLPSSTAQQLADALAHLDHHHTLTQLWGLGALDRGRSRRTINFHGPPGTGKTLAAEAIASHLGMPVRIVGNGDIESRYMGESEKNVNAVFEQAQREGAMLFFDEADSILGRRVASVQHGSEHALNATRNAMLQALDRFEGVVVFATNRVAHYDHAFHRRILAQVAFTLPDGPCREAFARRCLATRVPRATDVDAAWLGASTDGLSQAEIVNAVTNAAARAVVRTGPARQVTRDDLARTIEAIRATGASMEGRSTPRVDRADVQQDLEALDECAPAAPDLLHEHSGAVEVDRHLLQQPQVSEARVLDHVLTHGPGPDHNVRFINRDVPVHQA